MILPDTHVWIWWVQKDPKLSQQQRDSIEQHRTSGICVSVYSCWEVSMLVAYGRVDLSTATLEWIQSALTRPGSRLLDLTPEIAVESTQLPGRFHKDPADQIIVATSRVHDMPLATFDGRIRAYSHVRLASL